ncbi:SIR2 family protein [Halobacillus sp. A1]|uniref:SIR2 family protein n=1 Tax=Halobacillus sp. A1 TaxID=2880262 RepID=UPI0020A65B20|nr:SIR2 family protein [Halobacillus sp. A1]MCP3032320.1 SIR2 family protein [Halobacillus sp. A1]
MSKFDELLEQIHRHLDCTYQNWLFGAGISFESNIPLMYPMTEKIESELEGDDFDTFCKIKEFLPNSSHVEHYLSHIGDLLALLDRSHASEITMNNVKYEYSSLYTLYKQIIRIIGELVRFGYKHSVDEKGDIESPIVEIGPHQEFVKKLFNRRSNLENITSINFFTTNYDTLLEDALTLEKKEVIDGFTGGAMGFWNPDVFSEKDNSYSYKVYKLHGSIDWYKDDEKGLLRSRFGTKYLSDNSNLLIYPQATKYVETQKDPFALLFSKFRERLIVSRDNILVACGYSFGDNHINNEVEMAMSLPNNKTNLIIFLKETWDEDLQKSCLPSDIYNWLDESSFRDRVFVLTDKGIYNGNSELNIPSSGDQQFDWWTFKGMTNLLD